MPLIYILSIQIQPFLFLFTELSSQSEPGHGHRAPTPPRSPVRTTQSVELPEGLQLMREDGTFYDLVGNSITVTTPNRFHIGILDPNGILRPFFYQDTMVKVKKRGPRNFQIVPLPVREYLRYPYNRDLTSHNESAARLIAEDRNRQRGGRSR